MTTMEILEQAKQAKTAINTADTETKNLALLKMAEALCAHTPQIHAANK